MFTNTNMQNWTSPMTKNYYTLVYLYSYCLLFMYFRKPFRPADGSNLLHRVYRNGKVRFWLRPKPQDPSLIQTFEEAMCRKGINVYDNVARVI